MQPIAAMADDPSLTFSFPNPEELKPPLLTLDKASVGYEAGKPILSAADAAARSRRSRGAARPQRQRQDDARQAARGRSAAMDGVVTRRRKLTVGYFTQYQVEELDPTETPVDLWAG